MYCIYNMIIYINLIIVRIFKGTRTFQIIQIVNIHPVAVNILHLRGVPICYQLIKQIRYSKTTKIIPAL